MTIIYVIIMYILSDILVYNDLVIKILSNLLQADYYLYLKCIVIDKIISNLF